ncbi:MAG: bifunctional (p)ppGpp synthetase/guanosine-3',5'-bis(diphosphate) 3'-pyrophosphohydrolase [bacterium]|nr:bifunctional (p)ppGpp synthetase/guanosine-3',5'-bis(diphosphate) 3'-pyrophosphohydrolase [bacterium]
MSPTTTSSILLDLTGLLDALPDLTPNDRELIERAYIKAQVAHEGQVRKSGEPYFTHCVAVAAILTEMKLDAEAIAAALMHDILEDTSVTKEELIAEFNHKIANLVDGVTKLKNLPINLDKNNTGKRPRDTNRELEYMRKMFLTMGDDVRVVLIKLADRLHNMRTLGYMREDKQQRIATETLEIFAPLANRLGIWQIKWELEDLSFRYINPDAYRSIANNLDERRADREAYMSKHAEAIRAELAKNGITTPAINWRPKHIYSIYKKMQRKNLPFDEIYDVRAMRIIVNTIPECYLTLGLVHQLWRPLHREFDDYIASPKENYYQSLHTAVIDGKGKTIEIQIRTWEMHEHAEYGVAAHWRYKEGNKGRDEKFESFIAHLRKMMEFGPEVIEDPAAFMTGMKEDVFKSHIYVYTPKGDIVDLPAGATPIDFAYHIHTEIGERCRGAKVNGQLVSLNHQLKTGEQIEIITINRGGPSLDWLNPDLGYVNTHRARVKIRQHFRKLNRGNHITMGREVVERELRRMGVTDRMSFDDVALMFDYTKVEDFMAAVGAGDINAAQIAHKVLDDEREKQRMNDISHIVRESRAVIEGSSEIRLNGSDMTGLLYNIASCCKPVPGDDIVGYITRGRGIAVHRRNCANVLTATDRERLIDVSWGDVQQESRYAVPIEIVAYDRFGLMKDITTIIADEKVSISKLNVQQRQEIATIHLQLDIRNNDQLRRILSKIGLIQSVAEARRCNTL